MKNFEVKPINSINDNGVLCFLHNAALTSEEPAHHNMHPDKIDKLLKSSRFSSTNGQMYGLYVNGELEAMSGVSRCSLGHDIASACVRSWVNDEYRGKYTTGTYLFPKHVEWAKEHGCKIIVIGFNEYNKDVINILKLHRGGFGRRIPNVNDLPFAESRLTPSWPIKLNGVKQWIIYYKLDPDYVYDWESVKWKDK